MEGYPLYAEAANEKGLCIAGLNFPEQRLLSRASSGGGQGQCVPL